MVTAISKRKKSFIPFKSKSKLSLKKKIKLNDIAFDKIDHVTIPVFDLKMYIMQIMILTFILQV